MNLHIREATTADAAMIADLSRETFYHAFAADNTKEDMEKFLNEQFTREALMEEVGAPGNIFLLAFAGDEIAGYLRLRDASDALLPGSGIEVARLYTNTHLIGKGVGAMLMNAAINRGKQLEKDYIWLGVWEKNEKAIRFYSRFGFEKFAEHGFLLGNDMQRDWLMQRPL